MKERTDVELEALLELLAKEAPRLRSAGVTDLRVGDLAVRLAPLEPEFKADDDRKPPPADKDPWHDESTFGLPPGAPIPGMPRQVRD